MDELSVPVAFLIFNRPQTTRRVFEAIRRARPRRLLVVADGPRPDRPGEAERCAETRAILEKIDWDCDVEKDLSDVNLGCRRRIASGLDWVFTRCEEAIILEDDCLPDPSFFPFCAEMLTRYRDDHRVMAVAGVNFGFGRDRDASYYFSRYIHIWGWASWRRAWKYYDVDMKSWPVMRDGKWLRTMFPDERSFQTWQRVLQDTFDGRIGTWDYQLTYAAFMQRMLGIVPTRNLISNIGFGADATHTAGYVPFAELPLEPMPFPLKHPPFVLRDANADAGTQDLVYSAPRLIERVRASSFEFAGALARIANSCGLLVNVMELMMRSFTAQKLVLALALLVAPAQSFAAVDLSSPKSTAKSFYESMNNADSNALRDCLLIDGQDQDHLAGAFIDVILAGKRLADAAHDKFGATGDKIGAGALSREDADSIDKAQQTDAGEESTLKISERSRPLKFRKTPSGWKLILLDYSGTKPDLIPDQIKLLTSLSAAMNDTADDITAGRFPTSGDAESAIQQRLSEVMVKRYKPATTQATTQK